MTKRGHTLLSLLLALCMILGAAPMNFVSATKSDLRIYVAYGATDGDGSYDSPFGNLDDAVKCVNASGRSEAKIIMFPTVYGNDKHSTQPDYWKSAEDSVFVDFASIKTAHTAAITFMSGGDEYSDWNTSTWTKVAISNTYNNTGTNLVLHGPTILQNLVIVDSWANPSYSKDVTCAGNKLKLDNVSFQGLDANGNFIDKKYTLYCGSNRASGVFGGGKLVDVDNADKIHNILLGSLGNEAGHDLTFTNNVELRLNGGTLDNLTFGNAYDGQVNTFKKNINVNVKYGTTVKKFCNTIGTVYTYTTPKIDGALQIVVDYDSKIENFDCPELYTTAGMKTPIYRINAKEDGIRFYTTETTGIFSWDGGSVFNRIPYCLSADGTEAYYVNNSTGRSLTVPNPGTYDVKWGDSIEAIIASLATPADQGYFTFDSWEDDGKGTIRAKWKSNLTTYWLSANGSDENDGLSVEKPFATYKKVTETVGNGNALVYVIGGYTLKSDDVTTFGGEIILYGYDENASIASNDGQGIAFGGKVTLSNITYKRGNNAYIAAAHDITFDEGFTLSSDSDWWVLGAPFGSTSVGGSTYTVKDGTFTGNFVLGGMMPADGGLHITSDASLLVSGGSIPTVTIGSSSWDSCGTTTYDKNLLIYQTGGTIGKIAAVTSGNGSPTKIDGALEILLNNDSKTTLDSSLDNMTVGKRYIVRSGEGGSVSPVYDEQSGALVAGKVKITIEKSGDWATVVNGTNRTYYNTDSIVTLSEGTTSIIYASEKQYEKGTTVPMTWKTMDKGYITLIFDDNNTSLPGFYNIITGEYNMPICAAIPSNTLKNSNNAILHEIQNHGGEILSHTRDHLVLNTSIPWETVDYQLGESYRELTAEGFNVHGIILAGGEGQDQSESYRTQIEGFTNKYYLYSDKYGASTQYWKQRNWFSKRSVDELKAIIDEQIENKSWEVIYAHNFDECSKETLRAVLDYLKQKKAEGKVDVVTYRYIHETFGDWASPVDFGDTTYTVEFYGSDKTTFLGRAVTVRGKTAALTSSLVLADGYTFDSWSESVDNIQGNKKVYAICKDSSGKTVPTTEPSVVTSKLCYYVDATNGSNTNNGLTSETAFADFNAAVTAANGSDFDAVVIGKIEVKDGSIPTHVGVMTIRGYDENSEIATVASSGPSLGGSCKLQDIKFTNGANAWCSLDGAELVLGENIVTSGFNQIATGSRYSNVTKKSTTTVQSGTYGQIILGEMAALGSDHVISGDMRLNVEGGTVSNCLLGNQGWDTNNQKTSIYNGNILVRVDGGTLSKVTLGNFTPAYNGAVEFIFNNDTNTTFDASFNNVPAAKGKYFVYSKGKDGKVDFVYDKDGNSVAGDFYVTVPNNKIAEITNGDKKQYLLQSGKVTLSVGTSTINYVDASAYADQWIGVETDSGTNWYMQADTVTISVGGKITFPEKTIEKANNLFAGWYSDAAFTTPVKQGSTVTASTLYARYIPLNSRDLYLEGVQIRIRGSRALRFVSNITTTLRETLIGLHTDNAVLNPSNESFNLSDTIGYGSVVIPTKALGDKTLEKGGSYVYNNTTYNAATVPARKTFENCDGYDRYTVALTNIPDNGMTTYYSVSPYITYVDASGVTHTAYGQSYSASLYNTAACIYEDGASYETDETKKKEVLDYLLTNILKQSDGISSPLANTYRALHFDKKLTIGYLGGSITYGNSAGKKVNDNGTVSQSGGDMALSYVNRMTNYFKTAYPDATVESVNAGVSDTATNFGIYRLDAHLMNNTVGHDMPDLVFVEFTTNDWTYDGGIVQGEKELMRQAESLIRNIYKKNPYADIVLLSTVRDEKATARKVYETIAEKYDLIFVDVGVPLQKKMTERGNANESDGNYYYTVDNLHPSATGYGVYADEIQKGIKTALGTEIYSTAKTDRTASLPKASARSLWDNPKILPASSFTVESGKVTTASPLTVSMYGMSETAAQNVAVTTDSVSITEETTLSFSFTGTTAALIFGMNESGVLMNYTVDGKSTNNPKVLNIDTELLTFQKYGHTQLFVLEQELAYGTHTIKMTFKPTSEGKVNIVLGGAAVAGSDNGLQKLIALSIDDGPRNDSSNAILNVLEKYGAHATFFSVGSSINSSVYDVMKRMISLDCEIGNHGYGWDAMTSMTADELTTDFNKVQTAVYNATGVYPKVFRAPGNQVSGTMYDTIPLPIFGGHLGVSDWESEEKVGLQARITALRNNIVDGRIILIHDLEVNVRALDTVFPEMIADGYKIVTIHELYTLRGYNPSSKLGRYLYLDFPGNLSETSN